MNNINKPPSTKELKQWYKDHPIQVFRIKWSKDKDTDRDDTETETQEEQ